MVTVALAVRCTHAVSLSLCGYRNICQVEDILVIFTLLDMHFNATPAAGFVHLCQRSSSPACHPTQLFQIFFSTHYPSP